MDDFAIGVGGHSYLACQDQVVEVDHLWEWYGTVALEATMNPKCRFCFYVKLEYTGGTLPRPSAARMSLLLA